MSDYGLSRENLMRTLPKPLREDASLAALAEAVAGLLAQRPQEIGRLLIYPAIDTLDEALLDVLAYDFKVDWWDPNYTLEEKRRTLKSSWKVHRMLGTKAAVETAISAIYPNTKVLEWFEYGGKPYHFKIRLDFTGEIWNEERPRQILKRAEYYKSLRSHLDGMEYTVRLEPAALYTGCAMTAVTCRLPVPELADDLRLTRSLRVGGQGWARVTLPIPER